VKKAITVLITVGGLIATTGPAEASAALSSTGIAPAGTSVALATPSTYATGLNNPRGLAFDRTGALDVAEAGKGGTSPCHAGAEGGQVCIGATGAITRVSRNRLRRVVTGLPSQAGANGAQASGPSDVSVDRRGRVSYVIGLGGSPDLRTQFTELAGAAKLYRTGSRTAVADLGAYEKTANPDGVQPPDTNPNAVTGEPNAQVVADAGGNSLLRVGRNGRVSTLAVFPKQTVTGPDGKPAEAQSVPTSVVQGPDGAYYVGELTGFPFAAGKARVWRVRPGQTPTVYATGFTNIIDLAFGSDRKLYVLEIFKNGLLSGDRTGALLRVDRRGRQTEIASTGLTAPGGLAVRGRDAYVSNCSVCADTGSIVRISLR